MKTIGLAALAAALTVAGAARADSLADQQQADVRCMLGMYAAMKNPQLTASAASASLYYAGRIEGRDPKFDFKAELIKEAAKMSPGDFGFSARRCFDEIKVRGESLKAAAESLTPASLTASRRGVGN